MDSYIEEGKKIIEKINEKGFEAFFIGGMVRDFLLGIKIHDIDITTSAKPEDIEAIFKKTFAVGKKYGTITVISNNFNFEITTYRIDGKYLNNRKPESVEFSSSLKDDVERRDFTINALAMDKDLNVIDLVNGQNDLKRKVISAIGVKDERFKEDALRILRAFRFVSKLNFIIDEDTKEAMRKNKDLLKNVSNERILSELTKIISYPYANKAIQEMVNLDITLDFMSLNKGLRYLASNYERINVYEFFALCFYLEDMKISDEYRFSNNERKLINDIMVLYDVTKDDGFNPLLVFSYGIDISLMANKLRVVFNKPSLEKEIKESYQNLKIKKVCDLKYKGNEILKENLICDRRRIGEIIDELKYHVVMGLVDNNYDDLRTLAIKLIKRINGEIK